MPEKYYSVIPGFVGPCKPTWLNLNQVIIRLEGRSGFFKLLKKVWWWPVPIRTGEEFWGNIDQHNRVFTEDRQLRTAIGLCPERLARTKALADYAAKQKPYAREELEGK